MKYLLFTFVISLSFFACTKTDKSTPAQITGKNETPKALETTDSDGSSFQLKRGQDLLNQVYYELAEKRPDLQEIESLIDKSRESGSDLQDDYSKFSGKSERYYNSVANQVLQVKDSLLRTRILQMLETSKIRNKAKSAQLDNLIRTIAQKQTSIEDYHIALKVAVTLPAIEDFQERNLPNSASYADHTKQQDSVMLKMKKIIK